MEFGKEAINAVLTATLFVLLAMFGGLVAFIRKLNQSTAPLPLKVVFMRLTGELIISAFAGLMVYLLCRYWGFNELLTGVMVGIAGHLGGKAIDTVILIWRSIITGGKPS